MKICVIGAMEKEIIKFKEIFQLTKEKRDVYIGDYKDKTIYIVKSGIGKVNSGAITQYMIDTYQPDYIINSGCAGSLDESVKIMDVIISSYVTYHDFLPVRIMNESVPNEGRPKADEKLVNIAVQSLKNLKIDNYHIEPICSGDCFVTDSKLREQIKEKTGAKVVDMESASIGHIATLNQVPFVVIRTISDFSDGLEDFEEQASMKSSHFVAEMIKLL